MLQPLHKRLSHPFCKHEFSGLLVAPIVAQNLLLRDNILVIQLFEKYRPCRCADRDQRLQSGK